MGKINEMSITRSKQDMATLKSALAMAESTINPTRDLLYNIYENILTDAHLTSVINSRKNKVTSKNFKLVNVKTGKEELDKTKLFQTAWFYKFMEHTLDSIFYGHSLIQLGPVEDGKFTEIQVVDRRYVKPEFGIAVKYPSATEGVSYTADGTRLWCVPVTKDKKDLGLLMKVADLLLYKKMAMAAFAQYTELFGVPIRIGKMGNNQSSAREMMNMLKNMGTAAYGVFDKDDSIDIHESSGKSGEVFEQFLAYLDAAISKAIVGQTMTTDEGGSYSQANVHQNTFYTLIEADARFVEFTINDLLIPRMIEMGFPLKGYTFKFDNTEHVSLKDKFEMTDKLLTLGYEVPDIFILDEFGIPATKPKVTAAPEDTVKKDSPL
ncbi:hypothetical protein GCM10027293_03410 [Pontibacter aydingkolensis]